MEIVEDLCLAANIAGLIKMSCELQTSQNTHSLVFIYSFQAPMVARETTEKKNKTTQNIQMSADFNRMYYY